MKLVKGLYALMRFPARRFYEVIRIRLEHCLYRSKFFRTIAGYE
ncbi:hypothetical protein JCM14469_08820 [Desulfatiferula olefinivorans]